MKLRPNVEDCCPCGWPKPPPPNAGCCGWPKPGDCAAAPPKPPKPALGAAAAPPKPPPGDAPPKPEAWPNAGDAAAAWPKPPPGEAPPKAEPPPSAAGEPNAGACAAAPKPPVGAAAAPPKPVGVAAVAERIRADFPYEGFPVMARAYVRHAYRGMGFYPGIVRQRLDYCVQEWGSRLRAVGFSVFF